MPEPTVSDVHIPAPEKKISVKMKPTYLLEAVPIFKAGEWKGTKYTIQDLDEIVRNTNALIKSKLHEPPVKLGHDEHQEILLNKSGLPSFGWVKKLYRIGDEIFADIEVPEELKEWVEKRFYDKISAEIYLEYQHPETKENIGKVLRAVAFLGADLPAVKGLGSIAFHSEDKKSKKQAIIIEDKNLMEVKSMNKWTIEEIKRVLPCCEEKIKKYMESKNKSSLTGDELAELLAVIRYEEIKNEDENTNTIECPEGYKWDEKLQRCVRLDEKQEDRIVCPKGYKVQDGKCVPVETEEKTENEGVEEISDDLEGISEDVLFDKLEKIVETLAEKFQLPGGSPRGWTKESFKSAFESLGGTFRSCVENISDEIDDPESFCAWLKYRATGKWPGTKEWRASEKTEKLSELEQKIEELKEKIKEKEIQKFDEELNKIKEQNRNVILPVLDEYIDKLSKFIKEQAVNFDEKDDNLRNVFLKFLKEIVKIKTVQFNEIAKTPQDYKEKIEIDDNDRQKIIEKFNEIKSNEKVENVDLAILAEKISALENIPYRDALIKAMKLLKQEG